MRERITSEKSWRLQQSSRQMQDNSKSHSQDIRNFLCISLSIHSFNCNAMESKSRSYFFSWEGGLRPINLFIKCINASYLKGLINTRGVWFLYCGSFPGFPAMSVEDGGGERPGVAAPVAGLVAAVQPGLQQ